MYRSNTSYSEAVREFEKAFIIAVLRDLNGNQVRAAQKLGMHRNTLRRTVQELEVDIIIRACAFPAARPLAPVCLPSGRKR
jgi:DNA-binding NtrC family response regulator